MDFPYHFRALDTDGSTIRQSTVAFKTVAECAAAAAHADKVHGDDHVVCVSLDPKDPKNSREVGKQGFAVHVAEVAEVAKVAQ